jgi:hypothetical protein
MKYTFFIPIVIILLTACSSADKEEAWVARVGDDVITAEEFRLNYEFGFPQYKTGDDPKRNYLEKMIAEKLIAAEARKLKLDTLSSIRNAVATVKRERLIEEVFNVKVMDEIRISDEELKAEINKSAVSFQFRFLPALSKEQAQKLKNTAESESYEQALSMISNDLGQAPADPNDLLSSYVKAEDIDPELLAIIQDLPLQEYSEPVPYQGGWYVFQVTNLRRTPLSDYDYETKSVSYRKVLYNRKAMEGATGFISGLMEPMDLRTKRQVFNKLNPAFYDWYKDKTLSGDIYTQVMQGDEAWHLLIRQNLDEVLVETAHGNWTVRRWLQHFDPGLYQLRPDSFEYFSRQFANVVALVVRDYYLLDMALDEDMDEKKAIQREVRQWEDKWLFQELRARTLDQVEFTNASVQAFLNQNPERFGYESGQLISLEELPELQLKRIRKDFLNHQVMKKAEEVRTRIPVEINTAVLDTIQVSKEQRIPVQLFKQNSNRMAFPVVDPNW